MTNAKVTFRRKLKAAITPKESNPQSAITGNSSGVVDAGHGMIYVRLQSGQVIKVYNDKIGKVANVPVLIGYDKEDKSHRLQVLSTWNVYDKPGSLGVRDHHRQHEYPNWDTTWIRLEQLKWLLCLPVSGFVVQVYGGPVYRNGSLVTVNNQQVTLTAVTTGAKYVIIQISNAGVATEKAGTAVASKELLANTDIPAPDTDNFAICAVKLYAGQTKLRRDYTAIDDFFDLRFVNVTLPDHGLLTGLTDDDHTQYLLASSATSRGTFASYWTDLTDSGATTLHFHSGATLSDGDYGDITVTSSGLVMTIDNNAVTLAKLATQAADSILAEATGSTDVPTAVTVAEQTLVGRITGGHVNDLSVAQVKTLLGIGGAEYPCEGVLTLETGVPYSTADQADKTTLYFTPYLGGRIGCLDGTLLDFAELSLDISGYTASKPYDIWIYNNSGTATLDSTVWTNTTTRATAVVFSSTGIPYKSGDETRRYLGTIYMDSASKCQDTTTKRFVWNYYNQKPRILTASEATSHTYNGAIRKWNNSDTNNKLEAIIGIASTHFAMLTATTKVTSAGTASAVSFYDNGAAFTIALARNNLLTGYLSLVATAFEPLAVGYHVFQAYELGNDAGSTFFSMTIEVAVTG